MPVCFSWLPIEISAQPGNPTQDFSGFTAAGSYLAARHAGLERDAIAAAGFYRDALRRDPKNGELLDRAFLSLLVGGDVDGAVKFAERVLQVDKSDRVARLVLGVSGLKHKHFPAARRDLAQSVRGPITDLTATLLSAWSQYGGGDAKGAVATIDKLQGPDWYAIFKDLHAGMILDAAGQEKRGRQAAGAGLQARLVGLAGRRGLGQLAVAQRQGGRRQEVFADFNKSVPHHPLVMQALAVLNAPAPHEATPVVERVELPAGTRLAVGARGEQVRRVQSIIKLKPDGVFSQQMRRAVREFQERNGLPVDGMVGMKTAEKLNAAIGGGTVAHKGELPRLVASADEGAAEALYGLGASLGRRGGEDLGLVYLQLALYLQPNHPLALLSLADLYESLKKPELAIKAYERIPQTSPLASQRRHSDGDRPRRARSRRRGGEASHRAGQGIPGRPGSHHGARQRAARPQEIRRMRRHLQQGRQGARNAGEGELGALLFPRHLLRALASSGRSRKPT